MTIEELLSVLSVFCCLQYRIYFYSTSGCWQWVLAGPMSGLASTTNLKGYKHSHYGVVLLSEPYRTIKQKRYTRYFLNVEGSIITCKLLSTRTRYYDAVT
jgi:hypothetical protein